MRSGPLLSMVRIGDELGCSVDYLLGRTDDPATNTKEDNDL